MGEFAEILQRIGSQPGVLGTLVMSNNGIPVTNTFSPSDSAQYAALVADFLAKARTGTGTIIDGQNIQVLRGRSFKNELIIIRSAFSGLPIVIFRGVN
jgi:dynein light chain roadblock-type